MKLSNERLVKDATGLSQLTNKSLPVKVSYAIAKNVSKIEGILKIYNKEREKLIGKHSDKTEDGSVKSDEFGNIIFKDLESWTKDITELQSVENEIDIHKFSINDLLNGSYDMAPGELMMIDYMIAEE